ncbi:uncharacterized protein LOC118347659 [Juglans regia]|uniref:Uncharacterized protein LOC118347659 n=1 Tax=Juglans regia TaxID=51240 RepID=A0A6P9E8B5_JUGRE|nr:uncharacterized protein LOC118347659 [Juglans regia]
MGIERQMKANKRLLDLDRTFEISSCKEEQKVQYVGHLLQGKVRIWWDTKRQLLIRKLGNINALTWGRFKEEFDNRFFPESIKTRKAQEVATLVQGNLTVEQNATKFMKLRRFALHLIVTDLVNVTAITEAEQRSVAAQINHEQKMTSSFSAGGSNAERGIIQGASKGEGIMIAPLATCKKCGKNHGGECRVGLGVCFRCSQSGHMIRECPQNAQGRRNAPNNLPNQRPPVQTHVYAITPGEINEDIPEDEEMGVITGKITLYECMACAFFDSSATRSFVSVMFAHRCNLQT